MYSSFELPPSPPYSADNSPCTFLNTELSPGYFSSLFGTTVDAAQLTRFRTLDLFGNPMDGPEATTSNDAFYAGGASASAPHLPTPGVGGEYGIDYTGTSIGDEMGVYIPESFGQGPIPSGLAQAPPTYFPHWDTPSASSTAPNNLFGEDYSDLWSGIDRRGSSRSADEFSLYSTSHSPVSDFPFVRHPASTHSSTSTRPSRRNSTRSEGASPLGLSGEGGDGGEPSAPKGRKRRSASNERGREKIRRVPTAIAYDPTVPYPKNTDHVFILYTQSLRKVDVNERWITILDLVAAPPSSPLERALRQFPETYSRDLYQEDCSSGSHYVFQDLHGNFFDATYSADGPSIAPRSPSPSSSFATGSTITPIYSFIHFHPNTFVPSSSFPIGHRAWWRVQSCEGDAGARHRAMPNNSPGDWTARYDVPDDKAEKRRPARMIEHFSQCTLRTHDGYFPLSTLAKSIRSVLPALGR